jgi:hypothetical protein
MRQLWKPSYPTAWLMIRIPLLIKVLPQQVPIITGLTGISTWCPETIAMITVATRTNDYSRYKECTRSVLMTEQEASFYQGCIDSGRKSDSC